MCMSKPHVPDQPPPPQPAKPPDIEGVKNRYRAQHSASLTGGSVLTGPSGLNNVATAKATVLGGG